MFENLLAKLAGKWIAKKANLTEGAMDDTKKWYQSKGVWAGVIGILVAGYNAAIPQFHLPMIPDWIFALLAAAGVYSRVTATAVIEK